MSRFVRLSRVGRRSLGAVLLLACLAVAASPVLAEGSGKTGLPPVRGGEGEGAASVTYTQGSSSEGDLSAMSAGYCRAKSHHPHNSRHEGGNINQVSDIRCFGTGPLPELSISTTLQKEVCFVICFWFDFAPTGSATRFNATYVKANSAAACEDGTYRGRSSHVLVWPNGKVDAGWTASPAVSITCGR